MAKHNLDKLFSEGLENFESTPAPSAWDQIEKDLDRKAGRPVWSWIGIAASAAVLLAFSWFLLQEGAVEYDAITYEYSESTIKDLSQPAEVVYVPIYIHTIIEKTQEPVIQSVKNPAKPVEVLAKEEPALLVDKPVILAQENIIEEQPEVITLEEVPIVTTSESLIASAEIPVEGEPALSADRSSPLQPVTIIYKQGEPAKESNFTKALDYMEDVRLGEKKLVNFEKLKENFRSKFRSGEDTD